MLQIYFGEESFLIHQAIKKKQKEFISNNPNSLIEIFNGDESPVEDFLLSISQGRGLFVDKKIIILRDVFEYDKNSQDKILNFFKKNKLSEDVEIVISWNGKIKVNKLLNFLKKNSKIQEFKKITVLEIEKFISNKLEGKNQIDYGVAREMMLLFNNDLWRLDRELEKLINFKSGDKITREDFYKICEGEATVKIFDLVDAIGSKNKKKALELLKFLINQGVDVFYILSMMIFQIRNLVLVLDCKNKGIFNSQEVAERTKLHPFVVQKALIQLRGFNSQKLKEIYERAFALDINSKSGKINLSEALEDFIIKI